MVDKSLSFEALLQYTFVPKKISTFHKRFEVKTWHFDNLLEIVDKGVKFGFSSFINESVFGPRKDISTPLMVVSVTYITFKGSKLHA